MELTEAAASVWLALNHDHACTYASYACTPPMHALYAVEPAGAVAGIAARAAVRLYFFRKAQVYSAILVSDWCRMGVRWGSDGCQMGVRWVSNGCQMGVR